MLNTIISILKYMAVYILGHCTGYYIIGLFYYLKDTKGKHYCNECEVAYTRNKEELEYKYCAYCGKPLEELNLDD